MAQTLRAAATDGDDIVQIRATELAGAVLDGGIGNDICSSWVKAASIFTPRGEARSRGGGKFRNFETILGSDGLDRIFLSSTQLDGLRLIDGGTEPRTICS